jgi:hypothetical protein
MPIERETLHRTLAEVTTLATNVATLRRALDGEPLSTADRQYLSRCFDLIDLELAALREFVEGL